MATSNIMDTAKSALKLGAIKKTRSKDAKQEKYARDIFEKYDRLSPNSRQALLRTLGQQTTNENNTSSEIDDDMKTRMENNWSQEQKALLEFHDRQSKTYELPKPTDDEDSQDISIPQTKVAQPAAVIQPDIEPLKRSLSFADLDNLEKRMTNLNLNSEGQTTNIWGKLKNSLSPPERVAISDRCQDGVSNLFDIKSIAMGNGHIIKPREYPYIADRSHEDYKASFITPQLTHDGNINQIPAKDMAINKITLDELQGVISKLIKISIANETKSLAAENLKDPKIISQSKRVEPNNKTKTSKSSKNNQHEISSDKLRDQANSRSRNKIDLPDSNKLKHYLTVEECKRSLRDESSSKCQACNKSKYSSRDSESGSEYESESSYEFSSLDSCTSSETESDSSVSSSSSESQSSDSSSSESSESSSESEDDFKGNSHERKKKHSQVESRASNSRRSKSVKKSNPKRTQNESVNRNSRKHRKRDEKKPERENRRSSEDRRDDRRKNNKRNNNSNSKKNESHKKKSHRNRRDKNKRHSSEEDSDVESSGYEDNNEYSIKKMSFHQAASYIPYFDGDPDNLNQFCNAVREVLKEYGPKNEKFLLMHIANRLRGAATEGYRAKTTNYSSVEALLRDLTLHYANIGIADQINVQIHTIKQGANETAGAYGMRVEKLYNRLQTIIASAPDLSKADRDSRKRQADIEVLEQFLFGLRPPLDHLVRSKRPKTLATAVTFAIEFEGKQSARHPHTTAYPPKQQAYMRMTYGTEVENINNFHAENTSAQNPYKVNDQHATGDAYCNYCKVRSHNTEECRTLIWHAKNDRITRPTNNKGWNRNFRRSSDRSFRKEGNNYDANNRSNNNYNNNGRFRDNGKYSNNNRRYDINQKPSQNRDNAEKTRDNKSVNAQDLN